MVCISFLQAGCHGILHPSFPSTQILVTFKMVDTGEEKQEAFDTVVLAVGRTAETAELVRERQLARGCREGEKKAEG